MKVMVDTSVWADYFNGTVTPRTDYLHEILGWAPIVTGDLIVFEVLRGLAADADWEAARLALGKFRGFHIASSAFWRDWGFGYARVGTGEGHW